MPGRILQAIRRAGVNNPVMMLDEVDKLGHDYRGDPAAALLEVLDPEQNIYFRDNYLDLAFDLSRVFFITTANALDTVPRPLLDRMEVLRLSGYSAEEKMEIARRYLVPRQLSQAGLTAEQVQFPDETIRVIIRRYTREAGLRQLEQSIGRITRKVAFRFAQCKPIRSSSTPATWRICWGRNASFRSKHARSCRPAWSRGSPGRKRGVKFYTSRPHCCRTRMGCV